MAVRKCWVLFSGPGLGAEEHGLDDGEGELGGPEGVTGGAGDEGELTLRVVDEDAIGIFEEKGLAVCAEEAGVLKVGG
jgi:hypothetical protein